MIFLSTDIQVLMKMIYFHTHNACAGYLWYPSARIGL